MFYVYRIKLFGVQYVQAFFSVPFDIFSKALLLPSFSYMSADVMRSHKDMLFKFRKFFHTWCIAPIAGPMTPIGALDRV